jgi:hypothetical protein
MPLTAPLPTWFAVRAKQLESLDVTGTDPAAALTAVEAVAADMAEPEWQQAIARMVDRWPLPVASEREFGEQAWLFFCGFLTATDRLRSRLAGRPDRADAIARLDAEREDVIDVMRCMLIEYPDWTLPVPDHLLAAVFTVRVSWRAYLLAMWNLLWSAVRHPRSEATIDLGTGRVLYRT